MSADGAVVASEEGAFEGGSDGIAGALGMMTTSFEATSTAGGVDSRRGAGTDSRRGLGGGASRRDVVGGTDPGPLTGGTDPGPFAGGSDSGVFAAGGGAPLPGSSAGGGMDEERMRGLLGAPGGLLEVPTETTGTLGILAGGGMLSEVSGLAAPSASSTVEIFGFEVMPA